jgi:hypothetical protein
LSRTRTLLLSRADGFGEIGEQFLEERLADAVPQAPDGLAVRQIE